MGKSNWIEHDEIRLLLSILALTAPKLPDWEDVSKMMDGKFGASGCRQHYQILRKRFAEGKPLAQPKGKSEPRRRYKAVDPDEFVAKTKAVEEQEGEDEAAGPATTAKAPKKSKAIPSKAPAKGKAKTTDDMTSAKSGAKRKANTFDGDREDDELELPRAKRVKELKWESDDEKDKF